MLKEYETYLSPYKSRNYGYNSLPNVVKKKKKTENVGNENAVCRPRDRCHI